jgi:protease I
MFDQKNNGVLSGKKVAILATHGYEQSELFEPKEALEKAGAQVDIISLESGKIKAWKEKDWGKDIKVDKVLSDVFAENYDALMLPGGVINPDLLRREKGAVEFASEFIQLGKTVAAICHGPQLLIETGLLKGRAMTSFNSIKTDLINAGAQWRDEEVVVDQGLVTSRSPADIPAFCKKMIEEIQEGRHYRSSSKDDGVSATFN